jgi:type IV pilus assembly protein PilF
MRISFLIWAILCGCATHQAEDRQRAVYHLQIGSGHLNKGHFPEALAEFLTADHLDPDNAEVKNQLGLGYFLRGKFELAEKNFRAALQINGKFTEARNNLGRTLIELKRNDEAIVELRRASRDMLYVEPEKTLANLGLAYFNKGEYVDAEKSFFESLKLRRKNCMALSYYGRSLYELSSFEKAAESLDQAMAACKTSNFEDPYYFSALSYVKIGRREQAVARLEEGLGAFPNGQFAARARSMLELLK